MKRYVILLLLSVYCLGVFSQISNHVHVNSIGYLPWANKRASVSLPCDSFHVVRAKDGKVVFKDKVEQLMKQQDVGQEVSIADFSDFTKEGQYYIKAVGVGASVNFTIAEDVYNTAFDLAFNGLYLWRCGSDVSFHYQGDYFGQKACHLHDGYLDYIATQGEIKDGTKGWHDAGDYGKYVVNAGVSMGSLFLAWDHFSNVLKTKTFEIPETESRLPDFLEELKWETDWLLTMQYPDGSGKVSHKLTRVNFSSFIMPSADTAKRYFTEWGTSATANFVAVMAMASRYFQPYIPEYAKKCLDAAKLSYGCLKDHPDYKRFEQGDFRTGGYQTKDADDRIWATAEMWQTTGEKAYLKDFEKQVIAVGNSVQFNWDWQEVSNLGVFTYLTSLHNGKNKSIENALAENLMAVADSIVDNTENDVYGRGLGNRYYWGCNGTVARQVINLQMAYKLTNDIKYKNAALETIGHIFGRNYYNRSYVTGLGINPPMFPHDRRSGADGIENPWPGYLVGGGHTAIDWVDEEASYSHNEIALNWQAALIYALAGFVE